MNWQPPEIPELAHELSPLLLERIDAKTKPPGSLGRLEELALQLGLIQATMEPELRAPTVAVFAGDHGLAAEGVSPFPAEVTTQMVLNFLGGGAAINVFARQHGLRLLVVDAGVAGQLPAHPMLRSCKVRAGTRNALYECALSRAEVDLCLVRGAEIAREISETGSNTLLLGEMGIANSSSAALILSALLNLPVYACVGRGAGHDEAGLVHKRSVLTRARALHADAHGAREVLSAFGGCEIAMMTGAMLEAAARRMTIVIDGFIVTAALAAAADLAPRVLDYCVFAHVSAEHGHRLALQKLGGRPLLNLGFRLGEGSGAAIAWPILESAVCFLREMATFESAGVSNRAEVAGGK